MDPKGNMWLPQSHLYRGLAEARQAAKDYDADLEFGMNEQTGQWCVFLRQGATELTKDKPLPVLGFNEIPSRDELQKRLYHSDALRRGHEILNAIHRDNDAIRAEYDHKAGEAAREVAEVAEWGFRVMGKPEAPKKIFMGKKTATR